VKVGDLVEKKSTGQAGVIVNIKKAGFRHRKLDLVRCFSLEGRHFEARSNNLEVISESR
jgi:ribosomal protein S4E